MGSGCGISKLSDHKENEQLMLIIITGLSGAGKSLALRRLEDIGFYCADNISFRLLPTLVDQCKTASPPLLRVAVGIDSREAVFGVDWDAMLKMLGKLEVNLRIVFLDCSNSTLLRRYSETRRKHPMAQGTDIDAAIQRERALLQSLRDRAHAVIDTSELMPMQLTEQLEAAIELSFSDTFLLNFTSFGYKRGIPVGADIVLDMRFLPNPFYDVALRPLSGKDEPVRVYLFRQEGVTQFFDTLESLLKQMLPGFISQGKQQIEIAFGCTGGRHRSVLAAEEMAGRFSGSQYEVRCAHRDFQTEAQNIDMRFPGKEDSL